MVSAVRNRQGPHNRYAIGNYSAALCIQGGDGGGSPLGTRDTPGSWTSGAIAWPPGAVGPRPERMESAEGNVGGGSTSLVGGVVSGELVGVSASGKGTLGMPGGKPSPLPSGVFSSCPGAATGGSCLGDDGGAAASSRSAGGVSECPSSGLTRCWSAGVGAALDGSGAISVPGHVRQRLG